MNVPKQFGWLGLSLSATQWAYVGAAVLVAALALFGAGAGVGWGMGSSSATEKAAEAARKLAESVAKEREDRLKALNVANERNRELERSFDERVSLAITAFNQREGHEQATDAVAAADFRSGNDRLRLPVRTCGAAVTAAAEAATRGANGETGAELTPKAAEALYSIAADGDTGIRQLAGLQAWAEEAVKLCGGPPPAPPKLE